MSEVANTSPQGARERLEAALAEAERHSDDAVCVSFEDARTLLSSTAAQGETRPSECRYPGCDCDEIARQSCYYAQPEAPTPVVGREEIARALCVVNGRDPDGFDASFICAADNTPLPCWMGYEEEADAILALLATKSQPAGEVERLRNLCRMLWQQIEFKNGKRSRGWGGAFLTEQYNALMGTDSSASGAKACEGAVATLQDQVHRALDHYDMRSEIYTNDADVAAGMAAILRQALTTPSVEAVPLRTPPGWYNEASPDLSHTAGSPAEKAVEVFREGLAKRIAERGHTVGVGVEEDFRLAEAAFKEGVAIGYQSGRVDPPEDPLELHADAVNEAWAESATRKALGEREDALTPTPANSGIPSETDWRALAEERFAEIKRAQAIIDELRAFREATLTQPASETERRLREALEEARAAILSAEQVATDLADGCLEEARQANVEKDGKAEREWVARAHTYDRVLNAMQPALGAALRERRAAQNARALSGEG